MAIARLILIFYSTAALGGPPCESNLVDALDLSRGREKNWISRKLSFRAFEAATIIAVANAVELQPLWEWMEKTGNNVYFGGGRLRHLLRFQNRYLRDHTAKELVRRLERGLSLTDLHASSFHKDFDFYLPNERRESYTVDGKPLAGGLREEIPEYRANHFEFIPHDFFDSSVRYGGTSLEKIRVNPNRIDDPTGALRAYHDGRLEFLAVDGPAYWKDRPEDVFFIRSTDAIRFFRMLLETPQLVADSETLALLPRLVREDRNFLTVYRGGYSSEPERFKKAMAKLHWETGEDWFLTFRILLFLGVVDLMLEKGIGSSLSPLKFVPHGAGQARGRLREFSQQLHAAGFTLSEAKKLAALFGPRYTQPGAYVLFPKQQDLSRWLTEAIEEQWRAEAQAR